MSIPKQLSEHLRDDLNRYLARYLCDVCEWMAVEKCCVSEARSAKVLRNPRLSNLRDFLRNTDAGFSETLLKLIDQAEKKDSDIYKKAHISRQHFSKIRNDAEYKPTKQTAVSFALALELNLEQTLDLIGRAGFTLTTSSKFDLIIRYFIEHRMFDITQINLALLEFDQPLLGS